MSAVLEYPLPVALAQVAQQQLVAGDAVNKVDITRGGEIHVELAGRGQRRWFTWREGALAELLPRHDSKVPLAARLRDAAFGIHSRVLSYRPCKRLTVLDGSHQKERILKGFRRGRLA